RVDNEAVGASSSLNNPTDLRRTSPPLSVPARPSRSAVEKFRLLSDRLGQHLLVDDQVAPEHAVGFVPRDLHGDGLRDPGAHEVADGGPPEIMHKPPFDAGALASAPPRIPQFSKRLAPVVKHLPDGVHAGVRTLPLERELVLPAQHGFQSIIMLEGK